MVKQLCLIRKYMPAKTLQNTKQKFKSFAQIDELIFSQTEFLNFTHRHLDIDRKVRKVLTIGSIDHPKDEVEDFVSREKKMENCLIQLESAFDSVSVGFSNYIKFGKDRLTRLVTDHKNSKKFFPLLIEVGKVQEKYRNQQFKA
ncbi:hypothetical protein BpHYR1_007643 [Brachionus plicatilis]|uniref:Uncharacterized protein n=1 Tax=Brachionus plicatilis TaxID=10195 RepID=A0A3M7RXA0_BRAPC|nr:hypothetical protein BpHYR1_007643 [Brachionus plicatilis]